jgi:hypothetical protein
MVLSENHQMLEIIFIIKKIILSGKPFSWYPQDFSSLIYKGYLFRNTKNEND